MKSGCRWSAYIAPIVCKSMAIMRWCLYPGHVRTSFGAPGQLNNYRYALAKIFILRWIQRNLPRLPPCLTLLYSKTAYSQLSSYCANSGKVCWNISLASPSHGSSLKQSHAPSSIPTVCAITNSSSFFVNRPGKKSAWDRLRYMSSSKR